jgi:hypothetical protein
MLPLPPLMHTPLHTINQTLTPHLPSHITLSLGISLLIEFYICAAALLRGIGCVVLTDGRLMSY